LNGVANVFDILGVGCQIDHEGSVNSNYSIQHNLVPNLLSLHEDLFRHGDMKRVPGRYLLIGAPDLIRFSDDYDPERASITYFYLVLYFLLKDSE